MEKQFRLPKTFALAWVEALRSGKFTQGSGKLTNQLDETKERTDNIEDYKFCCLGVAGVVCGIPPSELTGGFFVSDKEYTRAIPIEIVANSDYSVANQLVSLLFNMNDNLVSNFLLTGHNVRPEVNEKIIEAFSNQKCYSFTFPEIADFIEDNVEFYEEEEK